MLATDRAPCATHTFLEEITSNQGNRRNERDCPKSHCSPHLRNFQLKGAARLRYTSSSGHGHCRTHPALCSSPRADATKIALLCRTSCPAAAETLSALRWTALYFFPRMRRSVLNNTNDGCITSGMSVQSSSIHKSQNIFRRKNEGLLEKKKLRFLSAGNASWISGTASRLT